MAITTVHNELIAVNAISGTAIADNAVTSVHIAQNNVGTVQIALNSVTSVSIALNQVTGTQIANNAITSTQLADNAVTATKIPDGTQLTLGATTIAGFTSTGIDDNADATAITIDSSENVGIGTTGPDSKLEVSNITANDIPFFISGGTASLGSLPETTGMAFGYGSASGYKKGAIIWEFTATNAIGKLHFCNDGAADSGNAQLSDSKMTIDNNGKVLIGDTASHTADLLQIETPDQGGGHGIQIRRNSANNDAGIGHILFGNNTDTDLVKISAKTDLDSNNGDSGALMFSTQVTNGTLTERMRIDSAGNVGIGVTPKTWYSNATALQISPTGALYNTSNWEDFSIGNNSYYNSSGTESYIQADAACKIRLTDSGLMDFRVAGAGSADAAISWTTALAIAADGAITMAGTMSTSGAIAVGQTSFSGGSVLADFHGSGNAVGAQLAFANDHNTNKFFVGLEGNTTGDGFLYQQQDADINFYTNNTFRAKLDNSGNFGIGEPTPIRRLVVNHPGGTSLHNGILLHADVDTANGTNGLYFKNDSTNDDRRIKAGIIFKRSDPGTRGTGSLHFCLERVNSDTNVATNHTMIYMGEDGTVQIGNPATGAATDFVIMPTAKLYLDAGGDTYISEDAANQMAFFTGGAKRFALIGGAGFFSGTVTASHSFSDERLKENITIIPNALDKIKTLRGITFTRKSDGSSGTGLIAQELEKVLPDAVYETKTMSDDDDTEYKAITYEVTVGLLVEGIKEQQTIIDDLKARIETLEG